MIQARRRAEDEDDLSMFLGSRPTLPHTGQEEQDEMGRVIPRLNAEATLGGRRTARAARRALRRRSSCKGDDEEGYSTDATLPPSDATDYLAALKQLSRQRDEILADVKANEFKDPRLGIGARFASWRERFDDSYIGAWGGLALVGAWEFWTRLEMLGWNPFEVNTRPIVSLIGPLLMLPFYCRTRERWTAFVGTPTCTSIPGQGSPMRIRMCPNWDQMEIWSLPLL
jgi:GC-rich sequence DNA-binding factor